MDDVELAALVRDIYAGFLDPTQLPDLLERVGILAGGIGTSFEVHNWPTSPLFASGGISEERVTEYLAHYHTVCPRVRWGLEHHEGTIDTDLLHLGEGELDRFEYYADFLRPQGLRYFQSLTLERDGDDAFTVVAVQRTFEQGPPSDDDRRFLERLYPHLKNAVELGRSTVSLRSDIVRVADLTGQLGLAVIFVDKDRVVRAVTPAARSILGGIKSVDVLWNRLMVRDAVVERTLGRALAGVFRGVIPQSSRFLLFEGESGKPSHSVRVAPLSGFQDGDLVTLHSGGERLAGVILHRLSPRSHTSAYIAELYRLTPREAELAVSMLEGKTPAEHAAQRGVTIHTARSQLASLRRKVGARNQIELLYRLSVGLEDD